MIFGLILAGGRSSRFGREKAAARLAGRPMIAWVADALQAGIQRLAISAPLGSPAASFASEAGADCLPDPPGSADGPLSGVLEGLRWAVREGGEGLVTAPCDTPFLPADYVRRMMGEAAGGSALVRTPNGLEPLCAIWPVSCLAALEAATGHPPVRRVLSQLGALEVVFANSEDFANVNTPEDFTAAEHRMAKRMSDALRPRL